MRKNNSRYTPCAILHGLLGILGIPRALAYELGIMLPEEVIAVACKGTVYAAQPPQYAAVASGDVRERGEVSVGQQEVVCSILDYGVRLRGRDGVRKLLSFLDLDKHLHERSQRACPLQPW